MKFKVPGYMYSVTYITINHLCSLCRLSVNNLFDSSIEVLAEELCKYKLVEVLG